MELQVARTTNQTRAAAYSTSPIRVREDPRKATRVTATDSNKIKCRLSSTTIIRDSRR